MIYHITSRNAWQESQKRGRYLAPSLDVEGFIHCSRREQVLGVANDFYHGQRNLLLLCIEEDKLSSELRWEAPMHPDPARAILTAEVATFPHIYGTLNLDAVVTVVDLPMAESGFALPNGLP